MSLNAQTENMDIFNCLCVNVKKENNWMLTIIKEQ